MTSSKTPEIKLSLSQGGSWGTGKDPDIITVLTDTANLLVRHFESCPSPITVYQSAHLPAPHNCPRAIFGSAHIRLTAQDCRWAQYAYQFSHELFHLLTNHDRLKGTPRSTYQVDEILAETASLFALRKLHDKWRSSAPHRAWNSYAKHFTDYLVITETPFAPVPDRPIFEDPIALPVERIKNGHVALRVQKLLQAKPHYWAATQYLPAPHADVRTFLNEWIQKSPSKEAAEAISAKLLDA